MARPSMRLEPQVVLVDALLDQAEDGSIRVPQFQRPFVWTPDRMLELFDSIERSYPIGSLLLWQTDEDVPVLDSIGDIAVPTDEPSSAVSYVLDGHQRLSTLFGVLRRGRDAPRSADQRHWKWWVYRALGAGPDDDRYRHYRSQGTPPPHLLPLRAVSRTMDFLEFSRGLEVRNIDRSRLEELVRQAEAVANKIKNYQLTLIRLVGGTRDEAVEVYTRLNRQGMRMAPDQMVSALTFRAPGRPTLADQIDEIIAGVAETGFGVIPRSAVFRTVLAVAGESDVMSPSWEAVAGRLAYRLADAVPAATLAIHAAVNFLRQTVELPLARLLPYAHQLMLLAAFFSKCAEPSQEQQADLRRWFWVTSWTDKFAGASYSLIRASLDEMVAFANGSAALALDAERVHPVPETFNLNSARTKAYLVWELREFPLRFDAAGTEFNPVKVCSSGESRVFRQVVDSNPHPANRVILPTPPGMSARQALVELWAQDRDKVLTSHGIPFSAWDRLREGDGAGFVKARAEFLYQLVRRFTDELLISAPVEMVGTADDDTE